MLYQLQIFLNYHMNIPPSISTRQKIGSLIKKFLKFLDDSKNNMFLLSNLIQQGSKIFKDLKKAMDMVFYFEGLGILLRINAKIVIYLGFKGMARKLYQYEQDIAQPKPTNGEEVIIDGKAMPIRNQILGATLLANIFFMLICKKQSLTKASVEQMAQSFMAQQKQFAAKNFVSEILMVLTTLNLVEKNQSTQVIVYTGPDLRITDQSSKKISWKVFELNKREQIICGRQNSVNNPLEPSKEFQGSKEIITKQKLPKPVHLSYFPELAYAVLHSKTSNWQKKIMKTIFIIGRSPNLIKQSDNGLVKRYQIDLQLNHKAVSKQHAVILYNFQVGRWQIRCLSHKNSIKVDDESYWFGDSNIWLRNKCEIKIGPEKILFLKVQREDREMIDE